MATFLNLAFLGDVSIIFVFLFIYAIVFGLLEMGKPFKGENKGLHALIALGIAIMAVTFGPVVSLIRFLIPWFLVMALVIFFILFGFRIFAGDKDVSDWVMRPKSPARNWIIIVTVIIMIFGLGQAFGQSTLEEGAWDGTGPGPEGYEEVANADDNFDDDYNADDFIDDTGVGNNNVDGSRVATDDYGTNVLNTIVNPKVLGLIFVMLVGVFAMFFLSD